jgi:NADH:ubiquinone oxidoreductase subunit 2 (subunit N)
MTGCVLSLAGIPLTAGFIAKYQVIAAGANASAWTLVLVLAASSAIGVFYYLRIVVAMFGGGAGHEAVFSESPPLDAPRRPTLPARELGAAAARVTGVNAEPERPAPPVAAPLGLAALVVLVALAILLIGLGVYPSPLQHAAANAAIALAGPP